jgi:AcrR family transcriptional regulator
VVIADSAPRGARARVRAELTREIKEAGRRQLAEQGVTGLSLRAIAREMGMVSSAIYRYYPSRDELLTALIIDSYESVGHAATAAEAAVDRANPLERWLTTATAVRLWALAVPQEWALIFGSPVPGYQAPTDTIDPAAILPLLIVGIVADAHPRAALEPADLPILAATPLATPMPASVGSDFEALAAQLDQPLAAERLAATAMAWSQLVGSVSFELFGHLHNVIHDYPVYFEFQMREIGARLDL